MDGQGEQEGEQLQRRLFSNAESKASAAPSSVAKLASLALGRATTTRCIPPGHRSRRLRNSSRSRRRTAFRTTAVPTLLDTVSPSRDASVRARRHQTHQRSGGYLLPPFLDFQEVAAFEEADLPGKRRAQPYFLAADTASRLRPLARRRRRTSWPARVLFRFRKPWVRFRFNLDGWYVRFDTGGDSVNDRDSLLGEGRAHNPGLAIESMRVVERIAEQARSGALFLIPNRPREVVQHAPRPQHHRTGGFPPEVASRVGFSRAVARARKRR